MSTRLLTLGVGTSAVLALGAMVSPLAASAATPQSGTPHAGARATPYARGPLASSSIVRPQAAASARDVPAATPVGPVTNGGFETGDLTGFTGNQTYAGQTAGGTSHLYAYSGATSNSGYSIPRPAQGADAAILDDGSGNGSEVLYQDIAVPTGGGTLSFVYSYDSFAPITSPNSLDYTTNATTAPNQQFRVDIVTTTAALRSVAAGDVLAPIVRTQTGAPTASGAAAAADPYQASAFTPASVDLTPYAGKTVRLRFATADNADSLLAEVDNITFTATPPAALPEAPAAALLPVAFLAILGAVGYRRTRRA